MASVWDWYENSPRFLQPLKFHEACKLAIHDKKWCRSRTSSSWTVWIIALLTFQLTACNFQFAEGKYSLLSADPAVLCVWSNYCHSLNLRVHWEEKGAVVWLILILEERGERREPNQMTVVRSGTALKARGFCAALSVRECVLLYVYTWPVFWA